MDKHLIIVGAGMQAAEVHYYLGTLGGREVDAFIVDPEYLKEPNFLGCPVLEFDAARQRFSPQTHEAFVAIGMRAMYWPFIQSSFSVLNTAFPPLMPSREKLAMSSVVVMSSRSSPGDHPSNARKFIIASGR